MNCEEDIVVNPKLGIDAYFEPLLAKEGVNLLSLRAYGQWRRGFNNLTKNGDTGYSSSYPFHVPQKPVIPYESILPPLAGGIHGHSFAIEGVGGFFLSEFSLHYLALFILSSLVIVTTLAESRFQQTIKKAGFPTSVYLPRG